MLVFALDPHQRGFADQLALHLDTELAPHEERAFEDGEATLRPLVDPCGADAYVVLGLHASPDASPRDQLCRLLFFIAALRDHGAARVSAVVPYFAFARKDRRTKPFDPVTLRYVAQLVEAVGAYQVIALEAHNEAAFQNAFRCPTVHLHGHAAFAALADELHAAAPVVVASPDGGGLKRAQAWQEDLAARLKRPVGLAMVDKRRSEDRIEGGHFVAGDVDGAVVLLVDDLIATGATLQRAALALRAAGAKRVLACAAHGLFVAPAAERLTDPAIDQVLVTDSVPGFRVPATGALRDKLRVMSCVPLFAAAMRASHAAWMR
ncbi:ribose-phosphate diphosphokinase [Aquabacterium humicola]|uniref:ribose-phosphate diphosphokinase n=1 Tax=Aquabacterium humicola TaxID=3237377 RepID=UPI00254371C6|nr:ribose-phosphate diphosphokinase [Rubrivivax pictus]